MLLERVAELLGFAASGAHPFCVQFPPQAQVGARGGPAHPRGPQDYPNTGGSAGTRLTVALPLPPSREGEGPGAAHGVNGQARYHPATGATSNTPWLTERYSTSFGVAAPEEYVPRMMDQGHAHEDERGSLLSPSWGDETLEAEPFREPQDGSVGHAGGSDYRVPLIP